MAILTFEVKGQTLTVKSSIGKIVENSINYLNYVIKSDDPAWEQDGLVKYLIVTTKDGKSYEQGYGIINGDNIIKTPGFQVSVVGKKKESDEDKGIQITTQPVFIQVYPSGATKGDKTTETKLPALSEGEKQLKLFQQAVETIEEISNNKVNDFLSLNDENYPTTKAVSDFVEEKIQKTASFLQEEITNHSTELNNNLVEVKNHVQSESSLLKNELSNTLKKNKRIEGGKIVSVDDVSPVEHEVSIRPHALIKGFYSFSEEKETYNSSPVYRTLFFKQGEYKSFVFPENVNIIRKIVFGKITTVGGLFYDNTKEIDSTIIGNATGISFRLYKSNTDPWPSDYTIEAVRSDGSGTDYFSDREFLSDKTIFTAGKNLFNEKLKTADGLDEAVYRRMELYLPKGTYTCSSSCPLFYQAKSDNISWINWDNSERNFMVNEEGLVYINVRDNTSRDTPWSDDILLQIETGDTATNYESYKGAMYVINQEGIVENIKSISPFMQVYSDHEGLPFSLEYNQDINKAYDELQSNYSELQSNYNKLKTAIENLGGTIE